MNDAIQYFKDLSPVMQALLATTFTWLLTALGASVVLFFKNKALSRFKKRNGPQESSEFIGTPCTTPNPSSE